MADNAVPNIANDIMQGYRNSDDNRWPTYDGKFLDRKKYMSASQAGNCERWIWFDNHADVLPPEVIPEGWGYFSRGHNVERWIVDMLRASGSDWDYDYLGEDQVSFYVESQSGTPDGLAHRDFYDYVLLEFKSYDPRSNTYKFPRSTHKMQVQQNMDVMSECLGIEINQAVIYYGDASNYATCKSFIVERDDKVMEELQYKADRIMAAKSADDMEPEGLYTGQCSLCPFTSQCSEHVEKTKVVTQQARRRRRLADDIFKKRK